jgi:hypothetical protein
MRRLAAIIGGLLGVLLVPLALSRVTALFLLPAHGLLTVVAVVGAFAEGWSGYPERAKLWGLGFLVATALMLGTLEFASDARAAGSSYWAAPWVAVLVWGWIPPVVAGLSGALGGLRRRALSSRAVALRRQQLSEQQ